MKNHRIRVALRGVLGLALFVSLPSSVRAQAPAKRQQLVYSFLGQYFRLAKAAPVAYKVDPRILPVVSSYAEHFDLRKVLSATYLTDGQFLTTIKVDSLLVPADFAAMQAQLAAWQRVRKLRAIRLRAAGIRVLAHAHRPQRQRLLPTYTTYRIFPPLFSQNEQLALFYVENFCGLECAGGQVNLLQRQSDGSWKFVLAVPIFVS